MTKTFGICQGSVEIKADGAQHDSYSGSDRLTAAGCRFSTLAVQVFISWISLSLCVPESAGVPTMQP